RLLAMAIIWAWAAAPTAAQPMHPPAVGAASAASPAAGQAAPAKTAPPATDLRHHPGPPSPPTPLADKTVITVGILITPVVGAVTAVGPIVFYLFDGWAWRRHVIMCSLSASAQDKYLATYHAQDNDA